MKPIVSPLARGARPDAGFTLAEMLVVVALTAILLSTLAQITASTARITSQIHHRLESARNGRFAQSLLTPLERATPGTVTVSPDRVVAWLGNVQREVRLAPEGRSMALWGDAFATAYDKIDLPLEARFEQAGRIISLTASTEGPPIAVVRLRRDDDQDCRFDMVVKTCL